LRTRQYFLRAIKADKFLLDIMCAISPATKRLFLDCKMTKVEDMLKRRRHCESMEIIRKE